MNRTIWQRLRFSPGTVPWVIGLFAIAVLLTWKLSSLVPGLSAREYAAAVEPVGWHGIYQAAFDLPLKLIRSVAFFLAPDHGQLITRLPNVLLGGLSIALMAWLLRQWNSARTALFATVLFATSAWVLHTSRTATFDVQYLIVIPLLLVLDIQLYRACKRWFIFYGSAVIWGLLLYVPGLVWLVLLSMYFERNTIRAGWTHFGRWWQRAAYGGLLLVWLPLLAYNLRHVAALKLWLGLPADLPSVLGYLKQLLLVPYHLFVRGPHQPELWLGRAPLFDAFTLAAVVIGIYFYATHLRARRTRLLAAFAAVGWLTLSFGGAVSLSLLIPLAYIAAATGIAYLLHEWLQIFPLNPLARSVGIGLIAAAVAVSCLYNLRAYFVAWPHSAETQAAFIYHR